MANIEKKNFNQPEKTNSYDHMKAEVITAEGLTFMKNTAEPGWQWTTHIKPVAKTGSCQKNHLFYMISGKLHVKMDDGKEQEFSAGDIGVVPAGHDGWTVGDKQAVWLEITH
jgi:uncharacterized cupin superfamily protein